MELAAVLDVVERLGLPIVVLGAAVFVVWRLGGKLLGELVASYRERIGALERDRDHFRDRSERLEDETQRLCQSMIADLRAPMPPGHREDQSSA